MSSIDPQQELFTELLIRLKALGYDVYDGHLPSDGTPYPFVYIGDSTLTDDTNKTAIFGRVSQVIHIYSNTPKNRGSVSVMLLEIKRVCRSLASSQNFKWNVESVNQRILPDNTTKQPLLHGVLEIGFRFN